MSRCRLDHPTKPGVQAAYGHDPVMGFFVDIMKGDRLVKSYDFFNPSFNRARPLMGALDFLAAEGFFTTDQLHEALIYLQDGGRRPSKGVARVVEVVSMFKAAD
jgi:hypothetical protein